MTIQIVYFYDSEDESHSFCGAFHSREGAESCVKEQMTEYSWRRKMRWERIGDEWKAWGYKIYIEPYEVLP